MIRCSTKSKEFKRLLEQRESYRLANLKLIEEEETTRHKELIKEERQREVFESLKVDWRKEMYPEVPPQEPVKIVEERKIEIPERLKSNWRNELNEAMTSSGTLLSTLPATGDTNLETINSGTSASYNLTYTLGVNFGSDGFNLGQDYLQFSGDPSQFNSRQAYTISIDTSTFTDISFSVIAGNGSNGGVTPNFNMEVYWYDANGNYGLIGVVPKTTSSLTTYTFTLPDGARGKTIDILIAEGNPPEQSTQYIGQSIPSLHPSVWDSTIAGYINALLSIQNPTSAQLNSSGEVIWRAMQQQVYGADGLFLWNPPGYPAPVSGFQLGTTEADRIAVAQTIYNAYGYRGDKYPLTYGVGNLNFQRRTPVNVFVPLDNPEAASFIRVGSDLKTGTPGDRYRKVIQQLKAGQNYTTTKFGSNFPGSNFTGIRDFTPSPIGKDAGYETWGKAAERNANQASSTFAQSQQSISSPPTYQYGNEADFQRWVQSQQTPVGTQVQLPGGGTLTRVPDGSSGFTPTMTYTYDKVTAAGVQKITATIPRGTSSYQQSTIPPKTQSQQKLTPQQNASINNQIPIGSGQPTFRPGDQSSRIYTKSPTQKGLNVKTVYHGTSKSAEQGIRQTGFKPTTTGLRPNSVWVGDKSVAQKYAEGGKSSGSMQKNAPDQQSVMQMRIPKGSGITVPGPFGKETAISKKTADVGSGLKPQRTSSGAKAGTQIKIPGGSSSLGGTGTASGIGRYTPGQGGRYGIAGIGLADSYCEYEIAKKIITEDKK